MPVLHVRPVWGGLLAALACVPAWSNEAPENLLGFASGVLPLRVEAAASARVGIEQAMAAIDGSPRVYSLTSRVPRDARVVFVYQLPALTVFDRLVVPGVAETPSPLQTFVSEVRVSGSAASADDGFVPVAAGTMRVEGRRVQDIELTVDRHEPVRWLRVELSGAMDPAQRDGFLEFSELRGFGRQEPPGPAADFTGAWHGPGLSLRLWQQGAVVQGCYDQRGRLQGTVHGPLLRATGTAAGTGVRSAFIGAFVGEGPARSLYLMRSSNGAPFRLSTGSAGSTGRELPCPPPETVGLGCGAMVHGMAFDLDSAVLRPESGPLLDALHRGLAADTATRVTIEGHTSSEGDPAYNQRLSERRAAAVVEALVQRGIAPSRLGAEGIGERQPIAPNSEESGRALNRRVEVRCAS
jgi:OmpA-OmpF porin, OOP family